MAQEKTEEKRQWYFRVCPKCKSRVHIDRRYCGCHEDIRWEPVHCQESVERPKMYERVNFDMADFTCNECEDCIYCASFGMESMNREGYGSLDCKHAKENTIRCKCCKIQIRCLKEHGGNCEAVIKDGLSRIQRIVSRRESGNPGAVQDYHAMTA